MEKIAKSVLDTNHPIFRKVRREFPQFQQRRFGSKNAWKNWIQDISGLLVLRQALVILLSAGILSFFIFRQITDPFLDYRLGDIAQRHLVAQKTMEMIDEETTEAKRKLALDSVLSVYDLDRRIFFQTTEKIKHAFAVLRKQHVSLLQSLERKPYSAQEIAKLEDFIDAKKEFSQILSADFADAQFESVVRLKYSRRMERDLIHLMAKVDTGLIVSSRELLKSDQGKGISLNRISEDASGRPEQKEQIFQNVSAIVDVESAREDLEKEAQSYFRDKSNNAYSEKVVSLAKRLVVPNLTLNRQETERRKRSVSDEIKPVIVKLNKGDSIVRYQEVINKRHLAILKHLEKVSQADNSRFQFVFTAVLLTVILFSLVAFLQGGIRPFEYWWGDFLTIGLLALATILGTKGLQFVVAEAFLEKFPQVPFDFYYYLIPVSAGAVIIRMLMDKEPTLIYSAVLSIVGGILLERNFFYAVYVFTSSLFASSLATKIETRGKVWRTGLLTGLVNVILIICIVANTRNAASFRMLWADMTWIVLSGLLSGVFTSILVVSLVSLLESLSGRTSDLRLLELANMNHPLLRDLMVKAPGTYHHSMVIGSLVEAGAEAIDANPLLCRVMAYYHDVGKMERPQYFIENQAGGYNRHDGLQPHMSAMIIRDHVKRGQELGHKFKLPQPIIAAMSEHHGSSTIWYFFNKAKSHADDPDSVLESDFQYDGEKPQSKETALVMLGDVVEAATRSIVDPTPVRLSGVVRNILNKYFIEGQLSECDLTLRELELIAKSFLDVLVGIYHARIEYGVPGLQESGKKRHGNSDPRSTGKSAGSSSVATSGAVAYPKPFQVPSAGGGSSKKS